MVLIRNGVDGDVGDFERLFVLIRWCEQRWLQADEFKRAAYLKSSLARTQHAAHSTQDSTHSPAPPPHLRHAHAALAQREQPRLGADRLDVGARQLVLGHDEFLEVDVVRERHLACCGLVNGGGDYVIMCDVLVALGLCDGVEWW